MFLTNDGRIYSCGHGSYGQLGLRKTSNVNVPTLVKSMAGKFVIKLACGWNHTIALVSPSYCYATGLSQYGQLGLRDLEIRKEFTYIDYLRGKNVKDIFAGGYHSWFLVDVEHPELSEYEIPSPLAESPRTSVERVPTRNMLSKSSNRLNQLSYDNLNDRKGGSFIKGRTVKDLSARNYRPSTMENKEHNNILPWHREDGGNDDKKDLNLLNQNDDFFYTNDDNGETIDLVNDMDSKVNEERSINSENDEINSEFNYERAKRPTKRQTESFRQFIQPTNGAREQVSRNFIAHEEDNEDDYEKLSRTIKSNISKRSEKHYEPQTEPKSEHIHDSIYAPEGRKMRTHHKPSAQKDSYDEEGEVIQERATNYDTAKKMEMDLLKSEPEPASKAIVQLLASKNLPSFKFNLVFTDLMASHKFALITCENAKVEFIKGKALGVIEKLKEAEPVIICSEVVKHEPHFEQTQAGLFKLDNQAAGTETVTAMIVHQLQDGTADFKAMPKSSYRNIKTSDTFMGPMYHMRTSDFRGDDRWKLLGLWALAFAEEFIGDAIDIKFYEMRPFDFK